MFMEKGQGRNKTKPRGWADLVDNCKFYNQSILALSRGCQRQETGVKGGGY